MWLAAISRGWSTAGYVSDIDNTSQLYAIYVPSHIKEYQPIPLVIALHGKMGTIYEFVFTDIAKLADDHGYIVVCPGGRGGAFYSNEGEQDVLDVIRNVKSRYRIDEDGVCLLGISMGGRGATYIGLRNADIFSAIASIYGTVTGEESILLAGNKIKIPFFVAHGTTDTVIPIHDSIMLVNKLERLGYEYKFKPVEGLGHDPKVLDIALPEVFLFFTERIRNRLLTGEASQRGLQDAL